MGRPERLALTLVVAAFAFVLGLWAVLVPPFQAPDERAHFDSALHLAIGDPWAAPGEQHLLNAVQSAAGQAAAGTETVPPGTRPTIGELRTAHPGVDAEAVDQMTQHPPTAYLLQAAVLRAVGFEHLRWDHALLALRLFDAVLVLPLPVLAWASVRRLTRSPRAAVVGAAAIVATPELASIGASVTNDALTMLLGGVVTLFVVLTLTGDRRVRTLLALGVALGALVLTKGTGLPAVPFVGAALLLGPGAPRWGRRLLETVGTLLVAGVLGGWWWVRNLVLYGTLQPDGYASIRPPQPFPPGQGPSVLTFLDVSWGTLTRTFWGSFGGNASAALSPWIVVPLTVLTVGVIAGWAFRRAPERRTAVLLLVFPALLLAAQTLTSIQGYRTTTEVVGTQGRYLFPAIVALVAVSAVAWRRLPLRGRGREALPTVVTALAFAVAAAGLVTARVLLVPGSGSAVWSEAGPGSVAVAVLGGVAFLLAIASVVAVHRVPSERRTGAADTPPRPPR